MVDEHNPEPDGKGLIEGEGRAIVPVNQHFKIGCPYKNLLPILGEPDRSETG